MNKKYQIIYADPPWQYNSRANHKTRFRGGAYGHYNLMSMEEIKALPIEKLADNNCALFLWVTFPYLNEQIKLFKHWGFKYRTVAFNWIKTNKRQSINQYSFLPTDPDRFFGVGYYTKSNSEICLLGIRGQLYTINNRISSIIISPRREHSRKPDEARDKIVKLFGDLSRIELFAREKVEGWSSWGDEIDSDIKFGENI